MLGFGKNDLYKWYNIRWHKMLPKLSISIRIPFIGIRTELLEVHPEENLLCYTRVYVDINDKWHFNFAIFKYRS